MSTLDQDRFVFLTFDHGNQCAICLSTMNKSKQIGTLYCGHSFHHKCIMKYVTRHNHCPMCRAICIPAHRQEGRQCVMHYVSADFDKAYCQIPQYDATKQYRIGNVYVITDIEQHITQLPHCEPGILFSFDSIRNYILHFIPYSNRMDQETTLLHQSLRQGKQFASIRYQQEQKHDHNNKATDADHLIRQIDHLSDHNTVDAMLNQSKMVAVQQEYRHVFWGMAAIGLLYYVFA